jgi:hypothetical protein
MASEHQVFSEQEVAEIMKRAVSLQEASKDSAQTYRPGVTREELLRAAQEMGVDPAFLEQAIVEKVQHKQRGPLSLLQEEQRVVEGELNPDDFDLILDQIRVAATRRHPVTQVGRRLSARAFSGSGLAQVNVTARNGRTRIDVRPTPILEILGTFYPAFILTMTVGSGLAAQGQQGLAAVVAGGAFAAAAIACRAWMGKSRHAATRLADKIQSIVSGQVKESVLRDRLENTAPGSEKDGAHDQLLTERDH